MAALDVGAHARRADRELELGRGADPRAPYLCDARRADGWFYLLYSGSNEQTSFGGLGHQKIGVARSTDLETWHVPPK